jgi:hypothetical protein
MVFAASSRHALNPGLTTPYWQYTGTSNRFAVEPGLASSRSVNGMRLANTGTPSTSMTTEPPPTPTPLARPVSTSAASSLSLRVGRRAESLW